ncbi:Undecaprenyl-diphosphatase [bioreactor metagenome]|uniref:Undecaprenyl-diphosphatase n=1 Tax=bioreactor metagenome TaxID=1076179 RepID=A0A645CTL5_9ZZZZ|nr:undecaprenyl-diphosphate phosphatase [Candidatus Metalachnospira sp.]
MQILKAMLLGLIQGFSEFFPISSSGNVYFFSNLLNTSACTISFDILMHCAVLVTLILVFYKDLIHIIKNKFSHFNKMFLLSCLPIFAFTLLLESRVETYLYSSKIFGLGFILTGAAIYYETRLRPGKKHLKSINVKDALIIGAFQAVGAVPAVSRTGLAFCGGLQQGYDSKSSLKYAYLLSVPAMLGKIAFDVIKILTVASNTVVTDIFGFFPMLAAFITAVIGSLVAIRIMQRLAVKGKFRFFAYYLFVIGVITLIDMIAVNKIF